MEGFCRQLVTSRANNYLFSKGADSPTYWFPVLVLQKGLLYTGGVFPFLEIPPRPVGGGDLARFALLSFCKSASQLTITWFRQPTCRLQSGERRELNHLPLAEGGDLARFALMT